MKPELAFSLLNAMATGIAFLIDIVWGWRVLGAFMIFAGVWTFWTRRAAYARPGRAASYLTGAPAILAGLVNVGIGIAIIINAGNLAAWVRRVVQAF
jgi:hypothetical protein